MACTITAFQLGLDVNKSLPRRQCPSANVSRAEASWASCFQASNQDHPITLTSSNKCGEERDADLQCSKRRDKHNVSCDQEAIPVHLSHLSHEDCSKFLPSENSQTKVLNARPAIEQIQSSNSCREWAEGNLCQESCPISCGNEMSDFKESMEQEIAVNQEFDGKFRLITNKRSEMDDPANNMHEERLDEIISAAELLFSCRNVSPDVESPKGSTKRRRTDHAPACSRKSPSSRRGKGCPTTPDSASGALARSSRASPSGGRARPLDVEGRGGDSPPPYGPPRSPSWRRAADSDSVGSPGAVVPWAAELLAYLQRHGQGLLAAICAHYRIDYAGDPALLRAYSPEQLAHNALFNPALPKAAGTGLPTMLRDVDGVTDFRMSFPRDPASGVPAGVARVSACLAGEPFSIEVCAPRACARLAPAAEPPPRDSRLTPIAHLAPRPPRSSVA